MICKLADFDEAVQLKFSSNGTELPLTEPNIGTPGWAAPETVSLEGTSPRRCQYGRAVDVWSFGILLFELLTPVDHVPYSGEFQVDRFVFNLTLDLIFFQLFFKIIKK